MVEKQKNAIIINPRAAGDLCWRRWERLRRRTAALVDGIPEFVTAKVAEATEIAERLMGEGVERFIVVGGDGTVHEVVNGMMRGISKRGGVQPTLGMIMLGTGRDFARSWDIPKDPEEMLKVALGSSSSLCDVAEIELKDADGSNAIHYFINGLSCGCSSEVIERVNRSKKRWGAWQYGIIGLKTYLQHKGQRVRVEWDEGLFEGIVSNLFVANGKYCGGGMCWAPTADPSDGFLELVIVEPIPVSTLLTQGWRIYSGSVNRLEKVKIMRTKRVTISAPDRLAVETDGEQPGYLPLSCKIIPSAIRVAHPNHEVYGAPHEVKSCTPVV